VAEAAFVVGSSVEENRILEDQRHLRARQAIAHRLAPPGPSYCRINWMRPLAAVGTMLVFAVGIYVGSVWPSRSGREVTQTARTRTVSASVPNTPAAPLGASSSASDELFQLEHEIEATRSAKRILERKVQALGQDLASVRSQLADINEEKKQQIAENENIRTELAETKNTLTRAEATAESDQATVAALQVEAASRESQLSELKNSVDRGRQMLAADREIRDIMTARDLHMVDVVDTDGKGHVKKSFGRAFYTQGKSLIFYAYDLPTNKLADGKFVYAAWGSNSNKLQEQKPMRLGIFYSDDQSQHRWVMKFEDPKVLQEIDTVFVTLEPENGPLASPTGKPILDAYFGTPPNHP
jgi:hypothetical protein